MSKKSPAGGPFLNGPWKNLSIKKRSIATYLGFGPLGFGPIQFLMDWKRNIWSIAGFLLGIPTVSFGSRPDNSSGTATISFWLACWLWNRGKMNPFWRIEKHPDPGKPTWQWKFDRHFWSRRYIFKLLFFHCHWIRELGNVSFQLGPGGPKTIK